MDTDIRVLVVDDDEFNIDLIEVMLTGLSGLEDLTILRALNGREALDVLEQKSDIDIILLDLEMPVLNGFDTLQIIKRHEQLREIPVIVVTSDRSEVLKTLTMGANDFLAKPYDPQELKLRVMNHVRIKKLNDITRDMNDALEREVVKKTAALQKALVLSQEAEYEISLRLGKAAEYRDLETGMHTVRISHLSRELAHLAGMAEEDCEILRYASPLHDVGKIGIPDHILLKPGKLTEQEYEIMQMHAAIGGKILSGAEHFPVIEAGRIIAEQHHERWDGNGYPNKLKGTDIHIYGRIVMIVDVFDALASERPYKKAFSIKETATLMLKDRGVFFDPELLDLFMANLDRFVAIKNSLQDIPGCEHNPFEEVLKSQQIA
ncbi:MAG: response regulator [Desulfuromonadaceae bacterium]|nr:response regulator [Desulfuromonadaceae bacterium]